jgi:hypothetical protein
MPGWGGGVECRKRRRNGHVHDARDDGGGSTRVAGGTGSGGVGRFGITFCAYAGGSNLTASTADAWTPIKKQLLAIAARTADGFTGAEARLDDEFVFRNGRIAHRSEPSAGIHYAELLSTPFHGEGAQTQSRRKMISTLFNHSGHISLKYS